MADNTKATQGSEQYADRQIGIFSYFFGDGFMCSGGAEFTAELATLFPPLSANSKVLDVGCGCGGASVWLAEKFGCQVIGVDVSEDSLEFARKLAEAHKVQHLCSFHLQDILSATFPNDHFDAVLSRDVLVHFNEESKHKLFAHISNWLKPNCNFVFTDYGLGREQMSDSMRDYLKSRGYTMHTVAQYTSLFQQHPQLEADQKSVNKPSPTASNNKLERAAVHDVTWEYCQTTQREIDRAQTNKSDFVSRFSEHEFDETVQVFERKIRMCCSGERRYLVGNIRKRATAQTTEIYEAKKRVWSVCKEMARQGLVWGSEGNVSALIWVDNDDNGKKKSPAMVIKPSGVCYDELEIDHMVVLDLQGNHVVLENQLKPSSEWRLHSEIYKRRGAGVERAAGSETQHKSTGGDVGGIVHTHSRIATAVSCARKPVPAFHYAVAEMMVVNKADGTHNKNDQESIVGIPCAGYHTYGTPELAQITADALGTQWLAALMANHGMIAVGTSVEQALQVAERCEALCAMYADCLALGPSHAPVLLTQKEIDDVNERDKTYGQGV